MPPRPPRPRNGPPIARLGFLLAWAAGSMLLWMLLTSTVRGSELVAGAIAAILTAAAVEAVRERERFLFRPRLHWLRRAAPVPVHVVTESWMVTVALVRHLRGRSARGAFVAVPFEHGPGADPEAAARRAALVAGLSAAPNTVVVGIDERRNEILVHQLVPDLTGLGRAVGGR